MNAGMADMLEVVRLEGNVGRTSRLFECFHYHMSYIVII